MFALMLRPARMLVAASLAAALAGCGKDVPKDAAETAQRLLAAAVTRDRVAFEAAVDRQAVREDLRGQLVEVARANGVEVDGGPSEFALDRMIVPEALRLVDASGQRLAAAPDAETLAAMMTAAGKNRVCVREGDRCLLTFARQKGEHGQHWRLVGMQAQDLTLQVRGS